jgi:uncharacterized metal-binding protein
MPSGRVHLRIEAALLVVWAAAAVVCAERGWLCTGEMAGFFSAYVFSMVLLSPDLDLAKSDSYRRWGPLRWLWIPYAAAFRHRRISHHALFGPITRVGYVAALSLAGWLAYTLARRDAAPELTLRMPVVFAVLIGLYLPNLTHIVADGFQSIWGRLRGRLYAP